MPLTVEVVSPERILYSGESNMVICRTVSGGEIAFLSGHVPFIGALGNYPVRVRHDSGPEDVFAVFGGFVEVSNDKVTILSDAAEPAADVADAEAKIAAASPSTPATAPATTSH